MIKAKWQDAIEAISIAKEIAEKVKDKKVSLRTIKSILNELQEATSHLNDIEDSYYYRKDK